MDPIRPIEVDPILRVERAKEEREREERREREDRRPQTAGRPAPETDTGEPEGPYEGDDGHLHIDTTA